MKKISNRRCPLFTLISIFISLVGFIVVGVFILCQIFSRIEHNKKWSDYDECGIF